MAKGVAIFVEWKPSSILSFLHAHKRKVFGEGITYFKVFTKNMILTVFLKLRFLILTGGVSQ